MIRIAMFHGAGCAGGFQSAPPAHQTTAADTRQSVDAVGIVARRSIAAGASAGCLILHAAGIARPLAAKIAVCVLVAIGWSHPCASEQDPSIASIDRIQQLLNEKKYLDAARQARTLLAEMESRGEVDGLEAAEAMDALVQALEKSGRIREPDVRKYAQLALEIRETHLKPDDLLVAVSLARLARVLDARGEYGPAVALYERSLPITEKATGAGDPTVGRLLVNLGSAYRSKGDYAKGKESCERGLRILEAALGPDHVDVANALNTLANALKAAGDFPGAEAAHRRALAIYESTLGPESAEVARSLNNLGNTLRTVGEYDEAKTLYERAYSINAGKFGTDSEEAAQSQIGVANLYLETGRPGEARPIYELVLAITEKAYGPEHPSVARDLRNLANVLFNLGDVERSLQLHRRALSIREKALGADHPLVALSLHNIAEILRARGDYEGARSLHERALAIRESSLGPWHPDVARSLRGLGLVRRNMGNDAAAKPLLERALSIREKALGPEHNYTASSVTDLAEQLCLMDESSAAGPLYERAIAIREKVVPGGLDLATSIASFAACLWSSGDPRAALIRSLEAESLAREQFRRAAIGLSQREAMNFEAERTSGLDIGVTALSGLQKGPALAQAAAKVLDDLIRSRAMVLDEMAGRHRAQVVGSGSELARLRDAYDRASRRLARLLVNGPDDDRPEAYRADLLKTRDAFDAAERALASKSAGFSRLLRKKQAGLAEVRSSLPRGSSLVSYVLYGRAARQLSDPPVPSYLAFVLKAGESAPVIRMLGTADEIDRRVARWRNLVAAAPPGLPLAGSPAERDYREAGSELRAAIWDPIASALEGSRQVFIVPDAALHLVSFATLPVGETRYLVENGPLLHYLSAERDLVEAPSRSRTGQGLLVLGGPDFDSARRTAGPSASTGLRDAVSSQAALRGDPISCEEFRRIRFEPLPGAGAEIGEIASIWERRGSRDGGRSERVLRLTGAGADEASLKHSAHGFGIVHLATHGFFVDSERCGSLIDGARKGARRGLRVGFEEDTTSGGNPLLLAGLALAGANGRGQRAAEEEDGILTAEEIATIDLSGVDWVVLSACETGIGKVTAGEGVLGLRRAFEIAGAGTLITSLWSVEDVSTRSWMRSLYENRLKGLSTAEAVRRADLDRIEAMRSAGGTTHPYYWSGFVAAGDWR